MKLTDYVDHVLKPYENEQPQVSMKTSTSFDKKYICPIERIPSIASANGISIDFQLFYDCLVKSICTKDYNSLYEISDKAISKEDFIKLFRDSVGNHVEHILELNSSMRGIDIEVNIDRFKQLHRNLIGGFFIMTYELKPSDNDFEGLQINDFRIVQSHTEILFSHKNGDFVVLSKFSPFVNDTLTLQ